MLIKQLGNFSLLKFLAANLSQIQRFPQIVFLLGPPGAGKGTYGKLLAEDLGLIRVSPGELIRKSLETDQSKQLDKAKQGLLVDSALIWNMIEKELSRHEPQKGVIFDGFPWSTGQLEFLTHKIVPFPRSAFLISLIMNEEILLEKILGRRICSNPNCSQTYNFCHIDKENYFMKAILPRRDHLCDHCDSALVTRADDNWETIQNRLRSYH